MSDLRLFDLPAPEPRPAHGALRYVCTECWRRVDLLIAPEEAPYCDVCRQRMILVSSDAGASHRHRPAASEGPSLLE